MCDADEPFHYRNRTINALFTQSVSLEMTCISLVSL